MIMVILIVPDRIAEWYHKGVLDLVLYFNIPLTFHPLSDFILHSRHHLIKLLLQNVWKQL